MRRLLATARTRWHVLQHHVEVTNARAMLLLLKPLFRHRDRKTFLFPCLSLVDVAPSDERIIQCPRWHKSRRCVPYGSWYSLDAHANERTNRVHFLLIGRRRLDYLARRF